MHAELVRLQVAGLQRAVLGISALGSMLGCEVNFEATLVAKNAGMSPKLSFIKNNLKAKTDRDRYRDREIER